MIIPSLTPPSWYDENGKIKTIESFIEEKAGTTIKLDGVLMSKILVKKTVDGLTLENAPYTRLIASQATYDALPADIKNILFEANIYED